MNPYDDAYGEDYDEHGRDFYSSFERDEDDWTCAFPGRCCMAFADHMRDECHTPEMAAEYMSADE